MNIPLWQYIVSMVLYIVLLLFAAELMRTKYKFAAVFWVLSLFTFPLWSAQLDGWFRWVKTFSVLFPTALIVGLARIANYENKTGWWKIYKKDWVLWSLYGLLGLNILEASFKDFALGNYSNGICGLILIVTIPLFKWRKQKTNKWSFSKNKPGDLLVHTDFIWNFLYTTWNLAFVFGENPGYAASSFCILFAAEIYPIIKKRPELYVTVRVYTLAIHILIRSTYDIFTPLMDSSILANQNVVNVWGQINLILHIPYVVLLLYRRFYSPNKELRRVRV